MLGGHRLNPAVNRLAPTSNNPIPPPTEMAHYAAMGGWHWYANRQNIRDEGWKLHVSGDLNNGAPLFAAVLPVLRNNNIAHKFLPTPAAISGQVGGQAGKILAVYPDDIAQAFQIVQMVDNVLQPLHFTRTKSPRIPNEQAVGVTVVYTRYGPYNNVVYNPSTGNYDPDPIGQIMPAWIQNPWPNYPNAAGLGAFPAWPVHGRDARRRGPRGG